MPKQPSFNGFNSEEICEWYEFFIKTIPIDTLSENKRPDDEKINKLFPKLSNWKEIVGFESMKMFPKLKKLKEAKPNPEEGFYFANIKGSTLKSLIVLLREAFVEGNLFKGKGKIRIEKEREDQPLFGIFDAEKIKSFIKLFLD